jgi:hypothetical protein
MRFSERRRSQAVLHDVCHDLGSFTVRGRRLDEPRRLDARATVEGRIFIKKSRKFRTTDARRNPEGSGTVSFVVTAFMRSWSRPDKWGYYKLYHYRNCVLQRVYLGRKAAELAQKKARASFLPLADELR